MSDAVIQTAIIIGGIVFCVSLISILIALRHSAEQTGEDALRKSLNQIKAEKARASYELEQGRLTFTPERE